MRFFYTEKTGWWWRIRRRLRKQIVATIHDSSYLEIDRTLDLVTSMQLQWMSSKLKTHTHVLQTKIVQRAVKSEVFRSVQIIEQNHTLVSIFIMCS